MSLAGGGGGAHTLAPLARGRSHTAPRGRRPRPWSVLTQAVRRTHEKRAKNGTRKLTNRNRWCGAGPRRRAPRPPRAARPRPQPRFLIDCQNRPPCDAPPNVNTGRTAARSRDTALTSVKL
ncbi:hypothetical protein EVAR_63782_1 [Eumeta japonica]|uniref:Uncharacterized protein n=1 Tax=Eumeta variegata TaxID=151549 RepID=A0A4C1ZGE0_EUMVA|nr:hypothetical protein EVAR_63782_1 [Eumeta japonica]